jgi:3-hydroxyisobutyrate dehydrogenase-like beta-hydroxyacid dehydrogenase
MARRLLDAGFELTVYNRSAAPADALVEAGARRTASPADAVAHADVVISMLTDDGVCATVWGQALPAVRAGTVLIEASTVQPSRIAAWAAQARAVGAIPLDAPVVGTLPHAEQGILTWLVGGPSDAFDRVRPVLEAMGKAMHHLGVSGQGAAAKLMVNAWFAGQVALLSEVLAVGGAGGLERSAALELLSALPVTAPAMAGVGGLMLAENFTSRFPIRLVAKDLRYASAQAAGPVLDGARQAFEAAERDGLGDADIVAISQLMQ